MKEDPEFRSHFNGPLRGTLGRLLRLTWAAISFSGFGAATLLLGVTWFPLLSLVTRDPLRRRRRARASVSIGCGVFIRFMGLVGLSWTVRGLAAPTSPDRCLLVANHPTLIDALFMFWLFPGAGCVAKATHWNNPFLRPIIRAADYLPNDDGETLMSTAMERLRNGESLILFPEGTRTLPNQRSRFSRGAAVLAARSGARLQPVRFHVTPWYLRKGDPWYRVAPQRIHYHIEMLDPVVLEEWVTSESGERKGTAALTESLRTRLLDGVN